MKPHNFKIVGGDTDSIMFCKQDETPFSKEEQESLLSEINSLLPAEIKFANDGVFSRVIYLRPKNYCMIDAKGKRKIKGSALKSATLEPGIKNMLNEFLDALIEDRQHELQDIYHNYIKMVLNITDMKPWSTKKTLSPTTFNSTRANETKIVDAIKGTGYGNGDRVYLYYTPEENLQLLEKFDGRYNVDVYLKKLYRATERFETVLPVKEMFLNYSLKRNKRELEKLK
jgi:hypothetical protein